MVADSFRLPRLSFSGWLLKGGMGCAEEAAELGGALKVELVCSLGRLTFHLVFASTPW